MITKEKARRIATRHHLNPRLLEERHPKIIEATILMQEGAMLKDAAKAVDLDPQWLSRAQKAIREESLPVTTPGSLNSAMLSLGGILGAALVLVIYYLIEWITR